MLQLKWSAGGSSLEWRISSLRRAGGNWETRILVVGGEECVLTELNQL